MIRATVLSIACGAGVLLASGADTGWASDAWDSFRNGGRSMSPVTLPTAWSASEGIAWQRELAGYGQSAPVIHGGRVVVTAVLGPNCEQISVQCFELSSGQQLWDYTRASTLGHPSNYMHSRAAPTPVVDVDGVYAFFETGDFLALNWQGDLRWHRNETEVLGPFENNHGIGASPAADEDSLYLLVEHDGPSALVAIDKANGTTRWSTERASTKSWASPIIAEVDGENQVIVSSGGTVAGYRASDGRQLWNLDGFEGNSLPSPVVADQRLLIAARLPEFATDGQVRANGCLDLSRVDEQGPAVLWRADKAISEYASPVVCDQHAYFVNKANVLHCVDISSGEIVYRKRLALTCWATPIVDGERVYFFGKNGQTKIVRAGRTYEEVSVNPLWDPSDPPQPLHYVESSGGTHGPNAHGSAAGEARAARHGGDGASSSRARSGTRSTNGPGGGMLARLLAGDRNGDGVLEGEEIPVPFREMLTRIDLDGDGRLSRSEIEAMAESFAERRQDAAATARDPIVYGVAAAEGQLVIRTGTRLYAISGDQ
jgi:outer membrane protein assembly factor BamB